MAKFKTTQTKGASAPETDLRTQQALDQAAGGSGEIDPITPDVQILEARFAYLEPGSDDSRSDDTDDGDRQRRQAVDDATGRIAEAVRASRPRKRHVTPNTVMLAIGGLAGFLLHRVMTNR